MTISLRSVTRLLTVGWVILLALSLGTRYLSTSPNSPYHIRKVIAARFDHDGEATLPAWYQSCGLLISGLALAGVAARTRQRRLPGARRWALLSVLFALCSADEVAALHETFGNSLSAHLGRLGFGVYSWILAGIPLVIGLAIAYWPLIRAMPRGIMVTLVLAGVFYVTGAVGFEVIEARLDALWGSMTFSLISAVEESFEMVGIILFLRGTIAYAQAIGAYDPIVVTDAPSLIHEHPAPAGASASPESRRMA